MKGLLDIPRSILADLIRKRLWPFAVLLLVALVAVPVLIASSSSPGAPAPSGAAVATVPSPASGAAPAELTASSESQPERGGRVRDPFFDPPSAPSEDEAGGTPSAAAAVREPAKSAAKQPSAKPTASGKAKPAAPATAKHAESETAKPAAPGRATPRAPRVTAPSGPAVQHSRPVSGTYYRAAASLGAGLTTRPLTRLTPLGDRRDPAAVYLGVTKASRPYAVFALGGHATSTGDATCAAETSCRIIGLRPGDTQTITVSSAGGHAATHFVVHVRSVTAVGMAASKAAALRARVHPYGRSAIHAMSRSSVVAAALGRMGYRRSSGLLYSITAADARRQAAQ